MRIVWDENLTGFEGITTQIPPDGDMPRHANDDEEIFVVAGGGWVLSTNALNGRFVFGNRRVFVPKGMEYGFRAYQEGMTIVSRFGRDVREPIMTREWIEKYLLAQKVILPASRYTRFYPSTPMCSVGIDRKITIIRGGAWLHVAPTDATYKVERDPRLTIPIVVENWDQFGRNNGRFFEAGQTILVPAHAGYQLVAGFEGLEFSVDHVSPDTTSVFVQDGEYRCGLASYQKYRSVNIAEMTSRDYEQLDHLVWL